MPDPHDIVAEINSLLDGRELKNAKELADLAGAYAYMCRQANVRLRQCARYLRKSLRSEALYHAQITPDLLDIVADLDLRRLGQWNALCAEHSAECAEPLLMDIAAEINRTYARQAPLQQLQAQLRMLSLAGASVRQRLKVMWQIAALDQADAQLQQDITQFEAAAVAQIRTLSTRAFDQADIDTLKELAGDITAGQWRIVFPKLVAENVTQNLRQLQSVEALKKLNSLLPQLHASHGALDYDECKLLLDRWNEIASTDGLQIPDKLQSQFQPIADWAQGVERGQLEDLNFRSACLALDGGLNEKKISAVELQQLYLHARSFDQPLGLQLESRYQSAADELDLAKRRRTRIYFSAISILAVVLAVSVGFFIYRTISIARVQSYCLRLETAIEDRDVLRAEQIWSSMQDKNPELADYPNLAGMRAKIDKVRSEQADRTRNFNLYLAQALKASPANPDLQALSKARQFADSSGQKLQVVNLQMKIDESARQKQAKIDSAFNKKVRQLTELLAGVDKTLLDRSEFKKFDKQLAAIDRKLLPLLAETQASQTARASLEIIEKQIASLKETARRVKQIEAQRREAQRLKRQKQLQAEKAIQDLARCVDSAAKFSQALKHFSLTYPESAKAAQFTQAAQHSSAWLAVQRWQEIVNLWDGQFRLGKKSDIDKRLQTVNAYLAKHPSVPAAEQLKSYVEYLTAAGAALGDKSPWRGRLANIMTNEIIQLYCFTLPDGKRYYMPRGEKFYGAKEYPIAKVVLTPDVTKLRSKNFRVKKGYAMVAEKSPQAKLASVILARLADFDASNWDTFGFDIMGVIAENRDIDPVLKGELLVIVLGYVRDFSWGAGELIADPLDKLTRLNPGGIWWMDPDNEKADIIRPQIGKIITSIPSAKALKEIVRKRTGRLFADLSLDIKGYGFALRKADRWYISAPGRLLKTNRTLWIVTDVPGTQGKKLQLKQIGKVARSKVSIDDAIMDNMPEGTMVFVK